MTARTLGWIAIIVLGLFSLAAGAWAIYGKNEISMSQAQIQEMIAKQLPMEKYGVTISNARLDLSGSQIGVTVNAEAANFTADGRTRGSLRYDAMKGSFYFVPSELELTNLASSEGESVADKVTGLIDRWVDSEKVQQNADVIAGKANELAHSAVLKTSSWALDRIPVYTLPDDFKGNAARMFLTDVEVRGDTIVAHLSFWQFTKMVALYAVVFVIALAMAVALVLNPELGAAFLIFSAFTGGS